MSFRSLFILVFTFFLMSCDSGKSEKRFDDSIPKENDSGTTKSTDLNTGEVLPRVSIAMDTVQSYSLYLPKDYDPGQTWPILILLDAHARGKMPVEKYHELAEKHGWIIAGSNESQNGFSWDQYRIIIMHLLNDLKSRFAIDKQRIYFAGFSGGARVSTWAAQNIGGIAGVVGSSGGFPGLPQQATKSYSWVGICGLEDFNYIELSGLSQQLGGLGYTNLFLTFDGSHEWAPQKEMDKAISWFRLLEINANKVNDEAFKTAYIEEMRNRLLELESSGNKKGQFRALQEYISTFAPITDVSDQKEKLTQLRSDPDIKKWLDKKAKLDQEEAAQRQLYADAFAKEDMNWWRTEYKKLTALADDQSDPEKANMWSRTLSFLSLAAYNYSTDALQNGNAELTEKYIAIYTLVDPENSEHRYMTAQLMALQGNPDMALHALYQAVDLGFGDEMRLTSDPFFSVLQSRPDFNSLLSRMGQN